MKADSNPACLPSGDDGTTGLPDGIRVRKSDALVCAGGSLDELSAALGLLRALKPEAGINAHLESIQRELLRLGAELVTGQAQVNAEAVAALTRDLDRMNAALPPLKDFVLPGATEASARAHWARTVCRRAERDLVKVQDQHPDRVTAEQTAYLNRLSGWLFALARSLEL